MISDIGRLETSVLLLIWGRLLGSFNNLSLGFLFKNLGLLLCKIFKESLSTLELITFDGRPKLSKFCI